MGLTRAPRSDLKNNYIKRTQILSQAVRSLFGRLWTSISGSRRGLDQTKCNKNIVEKERVRGDKQQEPNDEKQFEENEYRKEIKRAERKFNYIRLNNENTYQLGSSRPGFK